VEDLRNSVSGQTVELLIKNLICGEECEIYNLSESEGLNTFDSLAKLSGHRWMLYVGRYAVDIVDNVGKPPCSCMIFEHYFCQIHGVVLSELYSSQTVTVKQNS
jgi:hypothetical protein